MTFSSRFNALAVVAALFVACAGEIADPQPFLDAAQQPSGSDGGNNNNTPTCRVADVHQEIIVAKCGACHSPQLLSGKLDLTSDGVEGRLIGATADCATASKPLVDSADPTTGFFFDKLTPTPGCGTSMPVGSSLTAEEVSCIKGWLSGDI